VNRPWPLTLDSSLSDIGRIWADAAQGSNSENATRDAVSMVRIMCPEI
jgi:hypothetical protein